ncbi:hypothetical protein [Terrilactibacillus tamarindi]|nr:hypothetical protein [Terrilactibacillus tamarindi]
MKGVITSTWGVMPIILTRKLAGTMNKWLKEIQTSCYHQKQTVINLN